MHARIIGLSKMCVLGRCFLFECVIREIERSHFGYYHRESLEANFSLFASWKSIAADGIELGI